MCAVGGDSFSTSSPALLNKHVFLGISPETATLENLSWSMSAFKHGWQRKNFQLLSNCWRNSKVQLAARHWMCFSIFFMSYYTKFVKIVEAVLWYWKCWFRGSISLEPSVKQQSGGHICSRKTVRQWWSSDIKASVGSCIHLNLLGVSCTSHLKVLKTDGANRVGRKDFSRIFKCPNNTRLYFYLYVEDAVTITHCPRAALTWCCITLKSAQYVYVTIRIIKFVFLLWENHLKCGKWRSLTSPSKMREIVK